jgi:hypothetical protein
VDQQARQRGGPPLNSPPRCLIRLDRLRAAKRKAAEGEGEQPSTVAGGQRFVPLGDERQLLDPVFGVWR